MKPKIKVIKSRSVIGEFTVMFTIGVQSFTLQNMSTKKRAEWYAEQLKTAFKKFTP